jgi:hypothetical protein
MKNVCKAFGIIALVAVIGFSMVACDLLSGNKDGKDSGGNDGGGGGSGIKPTITIKNNTGYSIGRILIKPSTEPKSWGNNFLSGWSWDNLEDGKSGDYTLDQPLSVQKVYDIRLNGGGYDFIKYGVTVVNKMTITFTTGDLNNMSSLPKITIQNRSGKSFDSVYIKPTVSADWGESFGGVGNNNDITDITILIPPTNYTEFDIQAKSTNPTNTYTQTNITISNGMAILFTSAHKELPTIEAPVIVIQNNTGYTVGIYMKQSGQGDDWGSDLTGSWSWDKLDNGNSRAFSVSQTLGNLIDIKLTGSSYNFIKSNVIVSDGLFLTFTTSDLQP